MSQNSPARIRVLQLQSKYAAGVSHVATMIADALPADRYQVINGYLEGKPENLTGDVKLFGFSRNDCKGFRFKVKRELEQYCREENIDIVIAHRFKAISALMPVVRKLNIKAIAVVHGVGDYDRWYRRVLAQYYFQQHWQVVAVSEHVANYLHSVHKIFNEKLVNVIANAVDVDGLAAEFLDRSQARAALDLSENDFVFGACGRLAAVKGYDYLLDAFVPVAQKHPQAKLVLVGDGPLLQYLTEKVVELGVADQVNLVGYRENAKIYLKAFDVFIMPSRSEGLSIALLEAMAASLCILVSSVPSIVSMVPAGVQPLDIGDVAAWTSAMLKVVAENELELQLQSQQSFQQVSLLFNQTEFQRAYRALVCA